MPYPIKFLLVSNITVCGLGIGSKERLAEFLLKQPDLCIDFQQREYDVDFYFVYSCKN